MASSVADFAFRIKEKYPAYEDMDDAELTRKMLAKFPVYADMVDTTTLDTTETPQPSLLERGREAFETVTEPIEAAGATLYRATHKPSPAVPVAEEEPFPAEQIAQAQQVPQRQFGKILERGLLDVAPPEEKAPPEQAFKDFARLKELSAPPEEPLEPLELTPLQQLAIEEGKQEEFAAAVEEGPIAPIAPDPTTVAGLIRTTTDPMVAAAFMVGMAPEQQEALLSEMSEDMRRAVIGESARISQEAAGPAMAFSALKSTPVWRLVPKESRKYAENAMAQNPSAAMVGSVVGTLTQAIGVGGGDSFASEVSKCFTGSTVNQ